MKEERGNKQERKKATEEMLSKKRKRKKFCFHFFPLPSKTAASATTKKKKSKGNDSFLVFYLNKRANSNDMENHLLRHGEAMEAELKAMGAVQLGVREDFDECQRHRSKNDAIVRF